MKRLTLILLLLSNMAIAQTNVIFTWDARDIGKANPLSITGTVVSKRIEPNGRMIVKVVRHNTTFTIIVKQKSLFKLISVSNKPNQFVTFPNLTIEQ